MTTQCFSTTLHGLPVARPNPMGVEDDSFSLLSSGAVLLGVVVGVLTMLGLSLIG